MNDINEMFVVPDTRLTIINTGEVLDLSGTVVALSVLNDYDVNKMPLISVTLKITEEIRDKIRDNDVSLYIKCNVCDVTTEMQELDASSVYEKGTLFEGDIRVYDKPYSFNHRVSDPDNVNEGDISTAVNEVFLNISGVMENIIKLNEKIVNEVYDDCQSITAVYSVMNKMGVTNIKVDANFNPTVFKNILIPPMPPLLTVPYIQNYYNIYPNNANFFIDLNNKSYLYDNLNITNYNNTVNIVVTKDNTTTMQNDVRPSENPDNNDIMMADIQDPNYLTFGKITTHTLGSNSTFYSYDDMFNLVSRTYTSDKSYSKSKVFWNDSRLISDENRFVNNISRTDGISYLFTNINPYRINPFTKFVVTTDSSLIAGEYTVSKMAYTMETQGQSKYMNSMVNVSLVKKI